MEKELVFAINYALNKGFQIHPDALKILERIDIKELEHLIKQIVREKAKQKLFSINQDDLEEFLGLKNDEELESELRILSDPTPKVTSAEGVEGYTSLFSSRFLKLKKIISNRPEAKMLKTISSVVSAKSNDDMLTYTAVVLVVLMVISIGISWKNICQK